MAASSTTIINTVARRLRDNVNLAYPRAQLLRYIDNTQRVLNAYFKFTVNTLTLTAFNTFSTTLISRIFLETLTGTPIASVERVRVNGRTLDRVEWRTLVHNDTRWLVATGQRPVLWATIGKDYVVLYPRVPGTIDILEFLYVPAIPSVAIDNGTTDLTISSDLVPLLQDLVESMGCLTGRRFPEAADPIARIQLALDRAKQDTFLEDTEGYT